MASLDVAVVWHQKGTIRKKLEDIAARVEPRSRKMDRLRTDLKKLSVEDNINKLLVYGGTGTLAGIDKDDKRLAVLGKWAMGARFRRRGHGPVLAPHGLESRAITKFDVKWVFRGEVFEMWCGWKGIPWMQYHLEGRSKGSKSKQPNWWLPQRDISGISRRGMAKVKERFARFAKTLAKDDS